MKTSAKIRRRRGDGVKGRKGDGMKRGAFSIFHLTLAGSFTEAHRCQLGNHQWGIKNEK
jgi:hypothetical protein